MSNEEVVEAVKNTAPRRRSLANPIYWVGLCIKLIGVLIAMTIIGLPVGIALIMAGRQMTHKNMHKKGLL